MNREHMELRRIRTRLSLGQAEMAEKIGVKLPTYQAYEYGRTKAVNERVMERARQLLKEIDYAYLDATFGNRSMPDIAGEWAIRLGIQPGHVNELARMIGVDKSTVSRWYSAQAKPNPWELLRYEAIVATQGRRLHSRPSLGQRRGD